MVLLMLEQALVPSSVIITAVCSNSCRFCCDLCFQQHSKDLMFVKAVMRGHTACSCDMSRRNPVVVLLLVNEEQIKAVIAAAAAAAAATEMMDDSTCLKRGCVWSQGRIV